MFEKVHNLVGKPETRYNQIIQLLSENHHPFQVQSCDQNDCKNIVVDKSNGLKPYKVFVAHYDIVPYSLGINDNTISVALLIELLNDIQSKEHIPFKVVFTDKEESGMIGSSFFARHYQSEISDVIVLDIIGFGDVHVYGSTKTQEDLEALGLLRLNQILPSDNLTFIREGINTSLITAIHKQDILLENDVALLQPNALFYKSFHGGCYDDNYQVINYQLVLNLKDKILTLVIKKP